MTSKREDCIVLLNNLEGPACLCQITLLSDEMFYVYVLQSEKDLNFYTGFTRDLNTRIEEHNSKMSKATAGRTPLNLVYYEFCLNHKDAMKRERYLKTTWGKRYIKGRIQNYLEETKNST